MLRASFELPESSYPLAALEQAQAKARLDQKPLAFVFAMAAYLDLDAETTDLFSVHPAGATNYALRTLAEKAVIVFVEAELERGKAPPFVEEALYEPGFSIYTPPKVIVVDPEIRQVIAVIGMTTNIEERQRWFLEALERMETPERWGNAAPRISPTSLATLKAPPSQIPSWMIQLASGLGGFTLGVLVTIWYQSWRSQESDF